MFCIVGADGFFGTYMIKKIMLEKPEETILALSHQNFVFNNCRKLINKNLELSSYASIDEAADLLSSFADIHIFYTASVHNPDAVKKSPENAMALNTDSYEYFLDRIKNLDIKKLIYTSSDTVYGESINSHVFGESDKTEPVNIYGKQKKAAEIITLRYGHTAARYSYMAGPSVNKRKKHFFDTVSDTMKNSEKVYMLTDYIRNAISYKTAADLTYKLFSSDTDKKIFNICADKPTSKFDMGLKIAEYINCDKNLVIPCTSSELKIFTEKRADEILMDNSLIKKELGITDEIKFEF